MEDDQVLFTQFVELHKERTGKAPASSDIKKFIELEHQKKNPWLYIERLHRAMPTFITMSLIGLMLWLFTIVLQEKGATEGLRQMSIFFNAIPDGAWRLLQIMFGFWFAGKAGAELIDRWKGSGENPPNKALKRMPTPSARPPTSSGVNVHGDHSVR